MVCCNCLEAVAGARIVRNQHPHDITHTLAIFILTAACHSHKMMTVFVMDHR